MTKQILPAELAEIVTALLVKPELLGELDTRVAHQEFMKAIGCVVADFCGGIVNGVTDGDISSPYLSDVYSTPCLHIEADDRLPSLGYRKYKPPFCSSSEVSYLKFPHSFTAQAPILTAGPA